MSKPERKFNDSSIELKLLPKLERDFFEPMLARLVKRLPEGREWSYEVKFDGYRCIASKSKGRITLFSRNKKLFNQRYPQVAKALEPLASGTILDGEIVAVDESGRPSFNLLQNYKEAEQIYYYVFDMLAYRGRTVLRLPLYTRRELLLSAVRLLRDPVRLSDNFEASAEVVAAAKELGLEGIVAKRFSSLYEPGQRSGAWLKYKLNRSQELVIGGYTPGNPFDALVVGYYEDRVLLFVAKVRNGFVPRVRREVFSRFKGLETGICPFANLPEKKGRFGALTVEEMKKCRWLRPELVAQIEFTEWTKDNHLRHSRFAGLREDKQPEEVRRES